MKKRQLAIIGSTGSIGTQTLQVVRSHPESFEVHTLTAYNQLDLLVKQAREFMPEVVVIANETKYAELKEALEDLPIKVWAGASALAQAVTSTPIDLVVTAIVGYAGLRPTIAAIKAGKAIALANKETLVVAGELITRLAQEYKVPILPVDSEHSAIFQCLAGEEINPIEKIHLTASGGPFRTKTLEELANVTKRQALKHPNWAMGAKVTIDSASLMNKGFEMIEAKWLFNVRPDQVHIVVHPQSIVHSMIEFEDGSIKAQLGIPDMKLPIAYALSYPKRMKSQEPKLDFNQYAKLTFEEPDTKRFRNLPFAFEAINKGGTSPCTLNAANEIAVEAFLKDEIGFLHMSDVLDYTLSHSAFINKPTYTDYVATDAEARQIAIDYISRNK